MYITHNHYQRQQQSARFDSVHTIKSGTLLLSLIMIVCNVHCAGGQF